MMLKPADMLILRGVAVCVSQYPDKRANAPRIRHHLAEIGVQLHQDTISNRLRNLRRCDPPLVRRVDEWSKAPIQYILAEQGRLALTRFQPDAKERIEA